jgi:hypothetical protein
MPQFTMPSIISCRKKNKMKFYNTKENYGFS